MIYNGVVQKDEGGGVACKVTSGVTLQGVTLRTVMLVKLPPRKVAGG